MRASGSDDQRSTIGARMHNGLVCAGQHGVTQANANRARTGGGVVPAGPDNRWMPDAIKAVGNGGEGFGRNQGTGSVPKLRALGGEGHPGLA